MRLRLVFSPLDRRPFSLFCEDCALALVAGLNPSGRMTTPLPSAERTTTSPSLGSGRVICAKNASKSTAAAWARASTWRFPIVAALARPMAAAASWKEPRAASVPARPRNPWE